MYRYQFTNRKMFKNIKKSLWNFIFDICGLKSINVLDLKKNHIFVKQNIIFLTFPRYFFSSGCFNIHKVYKNVKK